MGKLIGFVTMKRVRELDENDFFHLEAFSSNAKNVKL